MAQRRKEKRKVLIVIIQQTICPLSFLKFFLVPLRLGVDF
jgi:hypothetical protein